MLQHDFRLLAYVHWKQCKWNQICVTLQTIRDQSIAQTVYLSTASLWLLNNTNVVKTILCSHSLQAQQWQFDHLQMTDSITVNIETTGVTMACLSATSFTDKSPTSDATQQCLTACSCLLNASAGFQQCSVSVCMYGVVKQTNGE